MARVGLQRHRETIIIATMTVMIPFNFAIYGRTVPSSDATRFEDRSAVVQPNTLLR